MLPSPLLTRPGAVASAPDDPDQAVPAHFGDPGREQSALVEGRAACALARDVVTVTGPDRLSWLTTLSSQVLTALEPGDGGAETLLLDAQGHITHALAALDDGRTLWLVTEADSGEALATFLDSMRFMLRVEVTERPDVMALGALGEGLEALAQAARDTASDASDSPEVQADAAEPQGSLIGLWRDPWPGVVEGGTSYDVGADRPHPGQGYRAGFVLVPVRSVDAVARAFLAAGEGRRLAGALAWEALRIEAGRPRWAREADARAIPHELDWLRTAVHLTKGCYPGQETIARTLNLGRPPRRLTVLQLDGLVGDLPRPGASVRMGERAVGAVTSVARHHELGPIALALLRRAVPVGEQLTVEITEVDEATGEAVPVGRVDAAQEVLVSPEGRAQASPSERPGAELRKGLRL
ncbi:glycine cleavage T C-terminal barrel domain-containing protein [Actinomyces oris]|uniref:Glycine cleavage T C-terminal barrel domain-containing protein n=1 Tax=Actinomyces oris TaxID=544580 RepID=A0AAW9KLV3_9ACTO|nr:glycine cleavage T C-terminal barrel domain-containing protein [Actinomyces oris]MEA1305682.1 glycine cleavage T C-terminal barrel domain-containing protein [Actinomyces oris]